MSETDRSPIYVVREAHRMKPRLFEWMTSLMMFGMSLVIAADPHSLQFGGFYLMRNLGFTPVILAVCFAIASCCRIASLVANGFWPFWGPYIRTACALFGGFLWVQMAAALVAWSLQSGYISIGVPVYIFLALGEVISCIRAAHDGRRSS